MQRLDRLHGARFFYFFAAVFAGAFGVVGPEGLHGGAEVVDDVFAIEIDVAHEAAAVVAVEEDMLGLAGGADALDDDADSVRWSLRGVGDVGRDEEGFAFADDVIDDLVTFAAADFDVA